MILSNDTRISVAAGTVTASAAEKCPKRYPNQRSSPRKALQTIKAAGTLRFMGKIHRQIELFGRDEVERQEIERRRKLLGDPSAPGDPQTLQRIRWAAEIMGNED